MNAVQGRSDSADDDGTDPAGRQDEDAMPDESLRHGRGYSWTGDVR